MYQLIGDKGFRYTPVTQVLTFRIGTIKNFFISTKDLNKIKNVSEQIRKRNIFSTRRALTPIRDQVVGTEIFPVKLP